MAFDAGMLACTVHEIRTVALGGRIEKVMQPERDEVILQIRSFEGGKRLLINAGSNPRIGFTELTKENPAQAPMFCMLLRKHLTGAKLTDIRQMGFERAVTLSFDTRDEMGFPCNRYLIAEVMGKYSNLIFAGDACPDAPDGRMRILSALKTVDFSTSSQRQILPGMLYELPPAQGKENPLEATPESMAALYAGESPDRPLDKFILSHYCGLSAAVAREMVFLATRHTDTPVRCADADVLWKGFDAVVRRIRQADYAPTLICDGSNPVEYAFCPLTQYTAPLESRPFDSAGKLLDAWFETRDRETRIHQRAADILRLLTHAEARIKKKLEAQRTELADCDKADTYRKYGDLITANMYALTRGMQRAELTDYENWQEDAGTYGTAVIDLDERLTPSANAQRYYKKYAKARNAKVELTKQIQRGQEELTYIYTIFDALTHAETAADLSEIRDELYRSGYASRMKGYTAPRKQPAPAYARFRTSGGFTVLCGKNNVQNEYITHKLAEKNDYWFHAKGVPGSHVVLVTGGQEPGDQDFTQAAAIAAQYSKAAGGNLVPVDYLLARNVRKVPGAKPGFVVYHTNWTAYVTPDPEAVAALRVKS
jgi:predicted ribosome quality control (RQC) complex YloA/Tae2 family protein